MVLTEAFAAGTPVVASDIPGYRDVVRDGVDGVLVPRGDATALAQTLRDLAVAPRQRAAMAVAGARACAALRLADRRPARSSRPTPTPSPCRGPPPRASARRVFLGAVPADLGPRRPAERRLPSLEASKREGRDRRRAAARKAGIGLAGLAAGFLALLALQRIGLDQIGDSLLRATPTWVLLGPGPHVRLDGRARRGVARDPHARRCPRRACGAPTPCRGPSSACSCPPRCPRASASPRAR